MKYELFIGLLFITILSCKSKKDNSSTLPEQSNPNDTTTFFDVKGFFESEIKDVSTTPYFIYKTTRKDEGTKDSMPINNKQFVQLAQQFLESDITGKDIKHYYKENIFRDLSTKSITFNYSTTNKALDVQNIDVLLDEETNKVKFIFIRADKAYGDSTVITQLNWNKGKSFLINKSIIKSDGAKHSIQQYVNWDNE